MRGLDCIFSSKDLLLLGMVWYSKV